MKGEKESCPPVLLAAGRRKRNRPKRGKRREKKRNFKGPKRESGQHECSRVT